MKRSGLDRLVSVLCALWLVVVLAEPAALHTCAEHGAAYPDVGHHGARGHLAGPHESPTKRPHQCSCVGACCFAVATVLSARADALTSGEARSPERVIVSDASDFRPIAVAYARPPTIGPPVLTA